MTKNINFLAGTVPVNLWPMVCQIMNWAVENDFKVSQVVNTMSVTEPQRVIGSGPAGPAVQSMYFVFCKSTPENFEKYFGFPYSDERLIEIPKLIGELEDLKKGNKASHRERRVN